jgi:hypothetical protein
MANLFNLMSGVSTEEAITAVLLNRLLNSKNPTLRDMGKELLTQFEADINKIIDDCRMDRDINTTTGYVGTGAIIVLDYLEKAQTETGKPRIRKVV